ncbi:MAG: amino acid permease, partial [Bdellovibrionia bacterium]
RAFIAAAVAGFFVLLFALMATPDLTHSALSSPNGGLPYIVTSILGATAGKGLLCVVVFAVFVCILAVHTGAVRIVFAMARDGFFPFGHLLTRVSKQSQIPVIPTVFVGLAALLILMFNVRFPKIVELVTAVSILWANLAYLLVVAALLQKRLQGWPLGEEFQKGRNAFSLGRWGVPINVLALLWSIFMVINVGWPRSEIFGEEGYQKYSPVFYTLILLASGAVYYGFRKYNKMNVSFAALALNRELE